MEITDWKSQMRRGLLEVSILGLLEDEPSYGYEIVTRLERYAGLAAGEGTVYPLLRRLRKSGLLVTEWRESDSGPPRLYYEMTQEGVAYLALLRPEWRSFTSAVDDILNRKGDDRE